MLHAAVMTTSRNASHCGARKSRTRRPRCTTRCHSTWNRSSPYVHCHPLPLTPAKYTPDGSKSVIEIHCVLFFYARTRLPYLQNGCEELLKKLDVKPNIDRLHAVVMEARARKQAGYTGKDVWTENLHPSAAARAQIVPLLVDERDRLKAQLAEVRRVSDSRKRITRV